MSASPSYEELEPISTPVLAAALACQAMWPPLNEGRLLPQTARQIAETLKVGRRVLSSVMDGPVAAEGKVAALPNAFPTYGPVLSRPAIGLAVLTPPATVVTVPILASGVDKSVLDSYTRLVRLTRQSAITAEATRNVSAAVLVLGRRPALLA